ncbi:bifunctional phosphatase IMPL2, chloroplastic-like [Chenopodium quinoa]|uniref:bifunctional phosphatase IMPL2, chloroplastic-like n=1 Tax=Chenopodium quinoa TaxID=63459 RepID=UPI000B780CF7|nr:bifunctional phosphatase IMPL2, chloroplastic-like [Chenopodium quinoa]
MCLNESDFEISREILDEFVRVANEVVDAAGIVVKIFFRKPRSIQTFYKCDEDGCIVEQTTTTVLATEDALIYVILQNFPDHLIFGEARGWFPEKRDADYVWVLDPIDGTTSFKNGFPLFDTLIALL